MSAPFSVELPVRWSDLDSVGVLNNAKYLTLMEEARFAYFRQLDLLENDQFPFVLGETTIRFQQPLRVATPVTVESRTTLLGTKSFTMESRILVGPDELARGTAVLVYVDDELSSRAIPERARRILSEFEGITS